MALTLGTTGMDGKTEAEVQAAFAQANLEAGGRWTLQGDDRADYVIVDMDSLYGPMSWLRLHAAGRTVIGLTAVDRSQTDYRLARPVNAAHLATLLRQIAEGAPQPSIATAEPAPTPLAHTTPAPAPADQLPRPAAMHADVTEAVPPEAPAMAPHPAHGSELDSVIDEPVAATAPQPQWTPPPEPAEEARPGRPLASWLQRDALDRRVRLQRNGGVVLLIDPRSRIYHGPAILKPLAPLFEGPWLIEDFATPDAAAWEAEASALGPAQPLARLVWLGSLLAGRGALLPGTDPDGNYRLTKWPQTEREYPKHFRIATAMMKGPATLDEVAAASGVQREDVADFVNANLVSGYAELVLPEPPVAEEPPQKPGGLFGRMRGR